MKSSVRNNSTLSNPDLLNPDLPNSNLPNPGVSPTSPVGIKPTLSDRPLTSQPSPMVTLRAIGIVAAIAALGVGAVLLIRGIRNLGGDRDLRPTAEVTGGEQPPLRDRVRVIKPKPISPSPQDGDDTSATEERPARRHQTKATSIRSSYGFGNGAPLDSSDAEDPVVAAEPDDPEGDVAQEAPAQDSSDSLDPSASEQPDQVASDQEPDTASETVRATIASLLQPPPPIASTAIATKLPPAISPPEAVASSPARPTTPSRVPTEITIPAPSTTPAIEPPLPTKPPIASTTPAKPPIAPTPTPSQPTTPTPTASPLPQTASTINPATTSDGVYVGQLQITGSTQFPIRTLAETVQRAIAANIPNQTTSTSPANPTNPSDPAANSANPTNPTNPGNPAPMNPASDTTSDRDPLSINRMLTAAQLLQASEAITKLYIDNGYINSGAYVPAEVLNGATPEIRVIEGRLETIKVDVTPADSLWLGQPLSSSYVEQRLGAAIRSPLKLDQLLDAVKLLEQDPLISSISTELAPGTTIGGSILNVKVRQAPPFRSNLSVSNNRSPSVGQLEQQAGISQANLLGLGDSLQVSFRRTDGSSDWSVNYSVPITPQNGTLRLSYTNGSGQVIEEPFRVLDISSQSQNYEIAFRQPLIQTSTEEFALTLRATHYSNKGIFLAAFNDGSPLPFPAVGADANGETRITALRFGQDWTQRSEQQVISLQSEFSVGLNALGATSLLFPPDSQFVSWQGQGFFVYSFAPDTLLAVRSRVQLADRPLVPSEQLSLGGVDTVRGYRPSTFLADNGWFASVEGYLPILRVPEWNGLLQVVPFFDVGQGWNNGDEQPTPNGLMSVGLGLQWKMGDNFRARLDWGVPLINAAPNGRSIEQNLFFSIIFSP